jgi:hypothetical protein
MRALNTMHVYGGAEFDGLVVYELTNVSHTHSNYHQAGQVDETGDKRGMGYSIAYILFARRTPISPASPLIPMWKRKESGLSSLECRQVSSEDDGPSCSLVRIWKQRDTRLAATSHFSWLSPVSPAVVLLPPGGPQLMSLGGTRGKCFSLAGLSIELACSLVRVNILPQLKPLEEFDASAHASCVRALELGFISRT